MAEQNGVRLQLGQVEVKQSSGRETPNTSFAQTLSTGVNTTAAVAGNAVYAAGYSGVPGAAILGAAINSAGMVRASAGGNGMPNGGGMTGMGAYGGMGGTMFAGGGLGGLGGLGGTSLAATTGIGGAGGAGSGNYMAMVASRAAGGDGASQMMMATQQMQEMNQAFNLQYLQLQEKMQQEGREFTCLSNVMKAKNDTAKNSLSNLK